MRAPLSLIVLLVSFIPALALPSGDYEFVFGLGGQPMGSETFHVDSFGDTLVMEGDTQLFVPRPQSFRVRTLVHLPDLEFVSCVMYTDAGDTLLSVAGEDSVLFVFRGSYSRNLVIPATGSVVPLDNAVAQHLWLLAQRRKLLGTEDDLTVLVPQQQYSGSLKWRESNPTTGFLAGEPIEIDRQAFSVTGVLSEIDIAEDGELMAFRVPLQGFEIKRADFRFTGVSAPEVTRFREVELTVDGGGPSLGATLTLPEGDGPFPGVVFLHGSGPMDRNETVGPNRVFWDLAQGLADQGIASLRYDKRTWAYKQNPATPDSILKSLTIWEEAIDDGKAAFELIHSRPEIDPDRCFILGHSLGAMAAPMTSRELAMESLPVKGLVLLAAPARDILALMEDQYYYLNGLGTLPDDKLEEFVHYVNRIREGKMGVDDNLLGAYLNYWDSVVYERPLRNFDAQEAPALFLFGDRDYQVPRRDRILWEGHFEENPRDNTRIEELAGLNHLFIKGVGEPTPEEYGIRGKVDPEVMDLISEWILKL